MIRPLPIYPAPVRSEPIGLRERLLDACVAYYPGDGSQRDFIGGNHGVLQGTGTTYVQGPFNSRAWHFDGNGWVFLPYQPRPSSRVFTFLAWHKPVVTSSFHTVYGEGNSGGIVPVATILVRGDAIRANVRTDDNAAAVAQGPSVSAGTAYFTAATADGDHLRLYHAAADVPVTLRDTQALAAGAITLNTARIGANRQGDSEIRHYSGAVGQVMVLDVPLSLEEIRGAQFGLQGVHYA